MTFRAREHDEARIALDVSDTGVGMRPEEQTTVFEAFGVAPVTGARAHGTGLELALAKRLVELQGGTISFTSTRGMGTTFTITLPKTGAATVDETGD